MSATTKITEEKVRKIFNANWVFKLYAWKRLPYIVLALLVSLIPLLIGLIFSLFWKASVTYIKNGSLWANTLALFLAFIAFGWFTRKLPVILVSLSEVFDIDDETYKGIVVKWARSFANRNWIMPLFGLPFAVLNLKETLDIWGSPETPILLDPWVNSNASSFFEVIYGFMHGIIVPFVLGSGIVGMIGVVGLLFDLFQKPLKLAYYRRTSVVIELTSWLMVWALVGLASILLFGRSFIITPVDIPSVKISALLQSVPATLIVLGIGSIPLALISNAITKAKRRELNRLEASYERTRAKLMEYFERSAERPEKSEGIQTPESRILSEELAIINDQIQQIENVPSLPIRWPSIARVSVSSLVSMGSPLIKDWWKNLMQS